MCSLILFVKVPEFELLSKFHPEIRFAEVLHDFVGNRFIMHAGLLADIGGVFFTQPLLVLFDRFRFLVHRSLKMANCRRVPNGESYYGIPLARSPLVSEFQFLIDRKAEEV